MTRQQWMRFTNITRPKDVIWFLKKFPQIPVVEFALACGFDKKRAKMFENEVRRSAKLTG